MIGQLRFTDGRVAFMTDDGEWHSIDSVLAAQLTLKYDPSMGPMNMPFGEVALSVAGDMEGAKVEYAKPRAKVPAGSV